MDAYFKTWKKICLAKILKAIKLLITVKVLGLLQLLLLSYRQVLTPLPVVYIQAYCARLVRKDKLLEAIFFKTEKHVLWIFVVKKQAKQPLYNTFTVKEMEAK